MTLEEELWQNIQRYYAELKKTEIHDTPGSLPRLQAIHQEVDYFYLLYSLRIYCRYLSYRRFWGSDLSAGDFTHLPALFAARQDMISRYPVLLGYHRVAKLLEHGLEIEAPQLTTRLEATVTLIRRYQESIPTADVLDLISMITNLGVAANNAGQEVTNLLFRLYSLMVGVMFRPPKQKGKVLPARIFKNLVILGHTQGLTVDWEAIAVPGVVIQPNQREAGPEWVAAFIRAYGRKLEPIAKDSYLPYCKAYHHFCCGNYEQVFALLHPVMHQSLLFLNLDIKLLLVQTAFVVHFRGEAKAKRAMVRHACQLDNLLEAYRKQIDYTEQEKKEGTYRVNFHRNFWRDISALKRLYLKYDQGYWTEDQLMRLEKESYELRRTYEKASAPYTKWLLMQLDNLSVEAS